MIIIVSLTLPVPTPDEEKKLSWIFIFALLCGASKGLMKALKAFIKLLEVPQRSVKIKIWLNFYFNATSRNAPDGRVNWSRVHCYGPEIPPKNISLANISILVDVYLSHPEWFYFKIKYKTSLTSYPTY